jgi:hypothetical protein
MTERWLREACRRACEVSAWWWGVAFSAALLLEAMLFVPFAGFNADEVMFLGPLFPPHWSAYYWDTALGRIPLMLMPYLGATKSLAYSWLVALAPPGPVVVRLPVVLLSGGTLYLFLRLVSRVVDRRTALVATALLAADTTFVLCISLDWAPAAVQLFGWILLANLAVRAAERPSATVLAATGLLAGFLVWNKAVFLFSLAGALVAAGIVFRDRIGRLSLRTILILACAFGAGSLPLTTYNASSGMGTWQVREALQEYSPGFKMGAAVRTLDGSIFDGYMFEKSPAGASTTPGLAGLLPRHDLLAVALLASALVLPWAAGDQRTRRLLQFAWLACLFTFGAMLPFRNAGAGPQHIVLLYPLPHLIVAATFLSPSAAGWLRRPGVCVLAAVICAGGLLTLAYRLEMSANGLTVYWTDAIYGLDRELREQQVTDVVAADWGIEEPLRALSEGRMRIVPDDQVTAATLREKGGGNFRILTHAGTFRVFPQRFRTVEESARAAGVELVPTAHVSDARGRVMFDVFSVGAR